MKFEEVLKLYIEDLLETNNKGYCKKLIQEADRMFPSRFFYSEGEHPFDLNYNERIAYYRALEHAYKDILYKINSYISNEK